MQRTGLKLIREQGKIGKNTKEEETKQRNWIIKGKKGSFPNFIKLVIRFSKVLS